MSQLKSYFAVLVALFAVFLSNQLLAAPASDLWPRWGQHKSESKLTVDHTQWDDLTGRFVLETKDGFNRFAYSEFKAADKQQLRTYISTLSNTRISDYNRNEQFAFWINLYNSVTVKVMLDNYPVDSIRDIKSGIFTPGPWDRDLVKVEGIALTLNDIEHRILRPIWQNPRIHYAVNCASIGCPNLQPKAFTGDNSEAMLDKAAREYINHRRAVRVNNGKLRVSSIYKWYKSDFGGTDRSVIDHIRQYASPALARQLEEIETIDNDDHYNWGINS